MTKPIIRRVMGAAAPLAIAMALSACGQQANDSQMTAVSTLPELPATLPLDAAGPSNWPTAPEIAALPDAKPLRSVRVANPDDYYGYADAAYDFTDVLGDAPPDYYFDYDGVDPWAWEGYDQSVVFVEPIDDGYRYYYYRPGADAPYFVRDPAYAYGYDGDGLAVIYDSHGAVVPYDRYGANRDYAARYYTRGRDMYAASRRGDRRGVNAAIWASRQPAIFAARTRWTEARERQPQWRDFHARAAPRQATYWREEATRRQADTRRFDQWRAQSFRTPAPPRAIPAAWSNARWARDDSKFRPARTERIAAAPQLAPRAERPQPAIDGNRSDRVAFNGRGNRPEAATDPRRAVDAGRPDRGASVASMRAARDPQGERARPAPQAANPPRAIAPPRAEARPGRSRDRMITAPRAERANPGNAPRSQPPADRPRPERGKGGGGNRPQFTAPAAQPRAAMAAPQRQPRAETPRPQRPQLQAAAPAPAPQQPRGNGGGGGKGGGSGNGNGGGGGKHH